MVDPLVRIVDADAPDTADPLLEYRPTHLPRAGEVIVIEQRPWHICSTIHEHATNIIWITVRSPRSMAAFYEEQRRVQGGG